MFNRYRISVLLDENSSADDGGCMVRELEKARFGKRREGAAIRLVSGCTDPRKEEVYIGMYVESYSLKGPVLLQGCLE